MSGAKRPAKRGRAKKTTTDTKVYLQHANELTYDIYGKHPDAQFVKGNVAFLHKGARLTCDSALYYQQTNSFEAFGHVRMKQGDTLTLTSEYAYYDGNDEMCEVRRNVILTHRKMKLYCDSLNYDRMYSIGYFFEGGKLIDGDTRLTSDWGQYSSADRQAVFYYNVKLKNSNSLTEGDTLYYDTKTSKAHVVGPSKITMKDDVIITEDGYYDSHADKTELFSRSTVQRRDGKTITADSLYHDSKTGISEGFSNVIFNDTANKSRFTGDYVYYDENTGCGYATRKAVAMDYSHGDTLYAHGDTMRLVTYNHDTDSAYRKVFAYPHVRVYRTDVQAVCDSMVMNSLDSVLTMYKDPILWSDGRQILGEEIRAYMADSTIRFAHVIGQALSVEMLPDTVHYNQVSSKEMKSWFKEGKLRLNQAQGNVKTVYYATDNADSTLIGLNYLETDTLKMFMSPTRRLERIWACKHSGTMYPISQIPPEKYKLPEFVWFDYVRPLSKDDIFEWRPKKGGTEIKAERRRDAPLQTIPVAKKPVEEDKPAETVAEKENDAVPETKQDTHAAPDDTPATLRKEETEEQENV
ncbi:MAG: OstA-like protein [Prevotella sp.]|nr:OstA-like protein [Prevotella sp.]